MIRYALVSEPDRFFEGLVPRLGMPGPAGAYGLKLISVTAVTKQRHSACESTDTRKSLRQNC